MKHMQSRSALSIVEVLVVIAVVAVLAALAAPSVSRRSAHRDAAALSRALTSTRWLAVTTGAPSSLFAQGDVVHRSVGVPLRCDSPPSGGEPAWTATGPLTLTWPTAGIAFGPDGRALRCDGSAVGNATIILTGRDGSRAAVIVASLGRVRWERR